MMRVGPVNTPRGRLVALLVAVGAVLFAGVGYAASITFTSKTITSATISATPSPPSQSNLCTLTSSSPGTGFADTYIDSASNQTTSNFGTATTLQVENKTNGNLHQMRGLLRFDLATAKCSETGKPLATGKTIKSAVLSMSVPSLNSQLVGNTIGVARAGASWTESSVTWGNANAALTGALTSSATAPLPVSGTTASLSWTVTTDVSNWYGGTTNNGWIVFDQTGSTADTSTIFSSREDTANATPSLVITLQ